MKKKSRLIVLLFLWSIFIANIGSLALSKHSNENDTCSITKMSNEIDNNGGEEVNNRGY